MGVTQICNEYQIGNQSWTGISAIACFSMLYENVYLDEVGFWELAKKYFSDEPIDFSLPKNKAEYFVFGNIINSERSPKIDVTLKFDNLLKELTIIGDSEKVSDYYLPKPFDTMPLRWDLAYGGAEFYENPAGRGYGGGNSVNSPNIFYKKLDNSSKYLPKAACTIPIPGNWQIKQDLLEGQDVHNYRKKNPGYHSSINYKYFQRAPSDQISQLPTWNLNSPYLFTNLHAEKSILHGNLPNVKIRAFLHQNDKDDFFLTEILMELKTLCFFPNEGYAGLIFNGRIPTHKLFSIKEKIVIIGMENIEEKRSINYYGQVLKDNLDPQKGSLYSFYDPILMPNKFILLGFDGKAPKYHQETITLNRSEKNVEIDINKEKKCSEAFYVSIENGIKSIIEANALKDKNSGDNQNFSHEKKKTFEATEIPKLTKILTKKKEIVNKDFSYYDFSGNAVKLTDKKFENCIFNFSKFSNINLIYCKFKNSSFAESIFDNILLENCTFTDCIFTDNSFLDTSFTDNIFKSNKFNKTRFENCKLNQCNFDSALLTEVKIYKTNLSKSNVENAVFDNCSLNDVVFDLKCKFNGNIFSNSKLKYSFFKNSKIDKTNFVKSDLFDSYFFDSVFNSVSFVDLCSMNAVKFTNCLIEKFSIKNATTDHVNFVQCSLKFSDISDSKFIKSEWNSVSAVGIIALDSSFEGSNFKNCDFQSAVFHSSWLVNTIYENCNMYKSDISMIISKKSTRFVNCLIDEMETMPCCDYISDDNNTGKKNDQR